MWVVGVLDQRQHHRRLDEPFPLVADLAPQARRVRRERLPRIDRQLPEAPARRRPGQPFLECYPAEDREARHRRRNTPTGRPRTQAARYAPPRFRNPRSFRNRLFWYLSRMALVSVPNGTNGTKISACGRNCRVIGHGFSRGAAGQPARRQPVSTGLPRGP